MYGRSSPAAPARRSRSRRRRSIRSRADERDRACWRTSCSPNTGCTAARKPGPIIEVGCWAHARRKFFEIARLKKAPIAKIDALFAIEREINGLPAHERKAVRDARSRPRVDELHGFLRERRTKLSGKSETAKAIDYSLKRWEVFTIRPSASCAPWPSAARIGPSPAPTKAAAALPPSTR